jgi:hypothetical protein
MNVKQSTHKNPFLSGSLTIVLVIAMAAGLKALQNRELSLETKRIRAAQNSKKITVVVHDSPKITSVATTTPTPPTPPIVPVSPPGVIPTPVTTPAPTPTPPAPVTPVPVPQPVVFTYKNGSYTAIGSYPVPGLTARISVTIVIANDIVSDSSVTIPSGTDPTSTNYDNKFINNYKTYVVGKALSSLSLSKISSASLTPNGFNYALNQIRVSAKG